jgi:hypothetical protein
MYVGLPSINLTFPDSIPDLQLSGLVICAIGTRNELFILSLEGKPSLQVVFLGRCIVQCSGNNGYNLVGYAEGLVEFFRNRNHVIERLPGVFWLREEKLLDL